jgi:lipid-A-disaccharide synthase-like uncharacterized protein
VRPPPGAGRAASILAGGVALVVVAAAGAHAGDEGDVAAPRRVKVWIPGVERVELGRGPAGALEYDVTHKDGRRERLSPDAFAEALLAVDARRPWWQKLMNISSPVGVAWVGLGLLGQLLFTGRMLVQWLASEQQQRSVVPVAFWWMSLGGASMLMVYFIWRKDVIGILGQSIGWIIYARNLSFIYRRDRPALRP